MSTILITICLLLLASLGNSDVDQDRAKCSEPLTAIATCLPFVTGEAHVPNMDCCNGFGQVAQQNPQCICLLIKDRDDPSLGLHINVTLALSIPQRCRSTAKFTVSDCPDLLHLPPNSPEAEMYRQLDNNMGKPSAAAPSPTPNGRSLSVPTTEAHHGSNGENGKRMVWFDVFVSMAMAMAMAAA